MESQEIYCLAQLCTCDSGEGCEVCEYMEAEIVNEANREFDKAFILESENGS